MTSTYDIWQGEMCLSNVCMRVTPAILSAHILTYRGLGLFVCPPLKKERDGLRVSIHSRFVQCCIAILQMILGLNWLIEEQQETNDNIGMFTFTYRQCYVVNVCSIMGGISSPPKKLCPACLHERKSPLTQTAL